MTSPGCRWNISFSTCCIFPILAASRSTFSLFVLDNRNAAFYSHRNKGVNQTLRWCEDRHADQRIPGVKAGKWRTLSAARVEKTACGAGKAWSRVHLMMRSVTFWFRLLSTPNATGQDILTVFPHDFSIFDERERKKVIKTTAWAERYYMCMGLETSQEYISKYPNWPKHKCQS